MEVLYNLEIPEANTLRRSEGSPSSGPAPVVCLITALTVEDFVDPDLTLKAQQRSPQLGVLTLAAILRQHGYESKVVNIDDLYLRLVESRKDDSPKIGAPHVFFSFIMEHLRLLKCDIFGLSSICSSYPLTLRLARELKTLNPDSTVILGGPQASVVDVATMHAFQCIDLIVRGEADETFPVVLDVLTRKRSFRWEDIPGITFRRDSDVIRNNNAPAVRDLDRLPEPAFDLDPDVMKRAGGIHLEIGRGCPFSCTFCSTNDFFRRNFRLKSPSKMLEEIKSIKDRYGIRYFSFVHDMYTVDRKRVVAFCDAVIASQERFTWGCSARTDCVDDSLLSQMADAGCRGMFFGIESGSKRLQSVIDKKLDLDEARRQIESADRYGIAMAVALIIGFPDETRDDLRDTAHFFVDVLRFDHAEPQLAILAPLAATPIYELYKDQLVFDNIFSEMSHQGWQIDPADVDMIMAYPDIFPNFYALPTTELDRAYLKELRDFLTYVSTWFRWLPVALLQDSGDLLKVFDRWRSWLAKNDVGSDRQTGPILYYAHESFRKDFVKFVRTCYLEEMATARLAIETLSRIEDVFTGRCELPAQLVDYVGPVGVDCVPYWRVNLRIVDIEIDYDELIANLRHQRDISRISVRKGTIALRQFDAGPSDQDSSQKGAGSTVQVWQLSSFSTSLLRLCDGIRTIDQIVAEFRKIVERTGCSIPAQKVCLFGLLTLRNDGFIGIATGLVVTEPQATLGEHDAARGSWRWPRLQIGNTQQPWPSSDTSDSGSSKIGIPTAALHR